MREKRLISTEKQFWFVVAIAIVVGLVATWSAVTIATRQSEAATARSSASYGWLRTETIVIEGTGTAGAVSASGQSDSYVQGHIYAISLDFASSISTTTDITVTWETPTVTILQLTDYYTDTWYYPGAQQVDSAGSGLGVYDRLVGDDRVTVAVGETVSGTIVTAVVYWGK